MKAPTRLSLVGVALIALVMAGLSASPTLTVGSQPTGRRTAPKLGGAQPQEGQIAVAAGPEPWFTVFATGEVVGYIEPCG